ncbi:MAG: folylpolyglutamate synthase/dihydrofolate synthase family protein [Arcanobacterium sp.]|nr:folylpolyglutamate synthase/dihydrofolate synthase family protein [Arcanobacterium sp.]
MSNSRKEHEPTHQPKYHKGDSFGLSGTSDPAEANFDSVDPREADDEALKALLSSGLIVGPDPTILDDIREEEDPAQVLANQVALDAEVEKIYTKIVARAPEHKVQPSLDRVRQCLDLLGNPQNAFRAVHITGTNGKTSTARMVEALLRERGLRTGRFTSPHLNSVRERITIDGVAISQADFVETYEELEPVIEFVDERSLAEGGPRMSFFEVFTVMAYSAFAMAPIDVAVIEVGMGGEWDATNVIDADVAMLMPVAVDHERWLGSTPAEIAREKLGIVKRDSVLVCAPQLPEVMELVNERVEKQRASLLLEGRDYGVLSHEPAVGGQMISARTPSAVYEDVPLAMMGEYQAHNAAAALTAAEAIFSGGAIPAEVVEHALMGTTSPGRMEIIKGSPVVIVDAAHNPAGAIATVDALEEYFSGPRVAVYSAMADKDIDGVLGVLEPAFAAIVVTQMPTDRAADIDDLYEMAREVFGEDRAYEESDLAEAITHAADLAETVDPEAVAPAQVVVLGSIQLAAEARALLGAKRPDGV